MLAMIDGENVGLVEAVRIIEKHKPTQIIIVGDFEMTLVRKQWKQAFPKALIKHQTRLKKKSLSDTKLAIVATTYIIENKPNALLIISHDQDFIPLVDFALERGIRVIVEHGEKQMSPLQDHASSRTRNIIISAAKDTSKGKWIHIAHLIIVLCAIDQSIFNQENIITLLEEIDCIEVHHGATASFFRSI
ncbi:NYN domain-containing protein [Vibrio barjaei]|uniref:NYN domain-containing protein n=1 Tax=Vibrio barjaei TaxID=1676683 RepID=UPI002284B1AE|nr:NYN domain-containing protein [Vibrio barjaei]MCY9873809.1 NYN domain-containing protein [Vibrio barjaei]